jgi:integrase
VADVDLMRGIVHPVVQYPAEPLKTDISKTPIPIPESLALQLSAHVATRPVRDGVESLLTDMWGQQLAPWTLERALRAVRSANVDPLPQGHPDGCTGCLVPGLPDGFRYHDLRHYFASLLIASGSDVKVVKARLRHASAKTTLDTYGHLWPDSDESTREAVDAVLRERDVYPMCTGAEF